MRFVLLDCPLRFCNTELIAASRDLQHPKGAQSGGVVTYEPAGHSSTLLPKLKGIRSRVVNAKRTDLSKGVRRKIEKDNFGLFKGLRGSNSPEYNASVEEGRLVRAFFGHTRFATTSKASCEFTCLMLCSLVSPYLLHFG